MGRGLAVPELQAVELQLLVDASHLAISRASSLLCASPGQQVGS